MNKSTVSAPELPEDQRLAINPPQSATKKSASAKASSDVRPFKVTQAVVGATCPYCQHKQDIPFEKGKNGKPFFVACSRCTTEFAVRFVPVTMYQAQVAAFK